MDARRARPGPARLWASDGVAPSLRDPLRQRPAGGVGHPGLGRADPRREEPLEWVLVTSVSTRHVEQAWERVGLVWHRWIVEDYHQCLKTGCRLEARQVQSADRLIRLLGLLSPLAVRLLCLRDRARREPERPAHEVLEADLLALVAAQAGQSPTRMTTGAFWKAVAQMGGYLARRGDGPPGWKTLWQGWLRVQTLLEGVHLGAQLRL